MTLSALLVVFTLAAGPIAPENSMGLMRVPDGVRVELLAAEPDVFDPVACAFDELGNLYVVENRGYPDDANHRGTIALLQVYDGRYIRKATFADGLDFPNGVMSWKGGILVTDAPRLLFLKDTGGDGVADVRETLLEGFSLGGSTQLRVSHPTLGLDNWIHLSNGLSGGEVRVATQPGGATFTMGPHDLRYNPVTGELQSTGGRAQFGLAFDDFGEKFVCSNRNHLMHAILNPADLARNPWLDATETALDIPEHGAAAPVFPLSPARTTAYAHAGTFTAACGLVAVGWARFAETYRGNTFVCEPTGNLVHRDVLAPEGATYVARRDREGVEFLASKDEWFRPVYLTNGPGESLVLCDMYRATIEHPTYLPPDVAANTDFGAGRDRGRIYRINLYDGGHLFPSPANWTGNDALLAAMGVGDRWVRDTARRLLLERQDASIAPALRDMLRDEVGFALNVSALSLLDGIHALTKDDVKRTLESEDPRVRKFAVGLARMHPEFALALEGLADDADPAVRFAAALALGDREEKPMDALARIAARAPGDPWTRAAVLSGVYPGVAAFTGAYFAAAAAPDPAMTHELGAMLAKGATPEALYGTLNASLAREGGDEWKTALLTGYFGVNRNERQALDALADTVSPKAAAELARLLARALTQVGDERASASERIESAELAAHGPPGGVVPVLSELLTPATPAEVQVAAIHGLFRCAPDAAIAIALAPATWNAFTDPTRSAALDELLRTATGVTALLDALEGNGLAPATIRPTYRARLVGARDAALKARAQALFPVVRQEDRLAVFKAKQSILETSGDTAKGKAVFENLCSRCHTYGNLGHEVGPDLTGIGSQPRDAILMHILMPNWLLLPGYENYIVTTKDFDEFSGIVTGETATTITIRAPFAEEHTIERANIETMEMTSLSMMPEAFEDAMTDTELRDLIEFLKVGHSETNP